MNEFTTIASLIPPAVDDRLIWETWTSKYHLPTVAVADEIGLFPFLAESPATIDEVIAGLTLGRRGAEVLLGILSALGFLVQRQGRFHLTDTARTYLLPDSSYYYGAFLRPMSNRPVSAANLRDWLKKDADAAHRDADGIAQDWQSGELSAELAAVVTPFMHAHSFPAAMGVARNGNFANVQRLLDVGGGSGCFCIALATRYPGMRMAVMELPPVCQLVNQYVARYGLQGHIEAVAANMFTDPWPLGYDGIFFSNVFHDWDRASCLQLAKRSFEALPPGGRIFLHEVVLNDTKDGPLVAVAFSMEMLALRGKQYSADELDLMLQEAGFTGTTVTPTYAYYALVSATKPR
jgi:hypothetical protein